jgi:hypothetical protein
MQKPKHKSWSVSNSFWSLLAAIDQDWYVMEPILKVNKSCNKDWLYVFILAHKDHSQLCEIVVPESEDLTRLIYRKGYLIETIS